jgi:hypothetical protein
MEHDERTYEASEAARICKIVLRGGGDLRDVIAVFEGAYTSADVQATFLRREAAIGVSPPASVSRPPPPPVDLWAEARSANSRRLADFQQRR